MPKNLPQKIKFTSGQTLISILIAMMIFAILANAIFTLTTASFKTVSFSKSRIAARHLAEEKVETIRNMPYDNVGTQGGIPSGAIPQLENRFVNGLNYVIKTSIVYIDDPFDGQSPNDLLPTDYKRVRIDVSWEGTAASRNNPIVITTDIAPKGIEKAAGGGTLSVLVFDANAQALPQASVHIVSNGISPAVNLTQNTNDNGRMIIPGVPACLECYDITVTKSGYSTDKTYTTAEVANPDKPRVSIVEGSITDISFAIDRTSTINFSIVGDKTGGFLPLPNTPFILRGQKTIGTDINDFPVYKYNKQFTTDGNGNLTITDVEWDLYTVTLPSSSSNEIGTSNPIIPYSMLPNSNFSWKLALYPIASHNLRVQFVDDTNTLVASVSATLTEGANSSTFVTGLSEDPDWGQVFYTSLSPTNYTLTATSEAFQDVNKTINVSGNTEDKIILLPK